MGEENDQQVKTGAVVNLIANLIGKNVSIKLNSGWEYKGQMQLLDSYMNVVLKYAEEYIDGNCTAKYGQALIRGNNVLLISPEN